MYAQGALGENDLLIEPTHVGIGRGDVDFIDGIYEVPPMPERAVGGHEVVGTVREVGPQVTAFVAGDRVGVGFQVDSCGECRSCISGKEQLCAKQLCQIADQDGALSGSVIANERFVMPIPAHLDSAEAAPLMCAGSVVFSAIRHLQTSIDAKVGVLGIGGVGHLAVQLLVASGREVTAIDVRNLDEIKALGAHHVDTPETVSRGQLDVVITTSPDSESLNTALDLVVPDGIVLAIGSPPRRISLPIDWINYCREKTVRGVYLGSPADMRELMRTVAGSAMRPIIERYTHDQLPVALNHVRNDGATFRAVVEM